jgi:hypothetical protein
MISHWLRAYKLGSVRIYSGHGKTNLPRPDSRDLPPLFNRNLHTLIRGEKMLALLTVGVRKSVRRASIGPCSILLAPVKKIPTSPFFFFLTLLTIDSQKEKLKIKISRINLF